MYFMGFGEFRIALFICPCMVARPGISDIMNPGKHITMVPVFGNG
jgi:hypothetical protein